MCKCTVACNLSMLLSRKLWRAFNPCTCIRIFNDISSSQSLIIHGAEEDLVQMVLFIAEMPSRAHSPVNEGVACDGGE